jgi:hypothetical protein
MWSQSREIPKVEPEPKGKMMPEKSSSLKLKDDARSWLKSAGAAVAVGFPAKDKDHNNIMLVSGLDKNGNRIAKKGFYVSKM